MGLLLAVAGTVFVLRDVGAYRTEIRRAFRASCLEWVLTFETFAEDRIIRNDIRSLESAAKLHLLGSGLYVDLVADGETLLRMADDGLDPPPVDPLSDPPMGTTANETIEGSVEVLAPIVLVGHPGRAIGSLRVGFSDAYTSGQIRRRMLTTSGIGLAAWLVAVAAIGWLHRPRRKETSASEEETTLIHCGSLSIDTRTCETKLNGKLVRLTPKQYELLLLFARDPETIFSDKELLEAVWPSSAYASSADVNQHIYLLRRKLGAAHPDPRHLIENVRGFGYRLVPPESEENLSDD